MSYTKTKIYNMALKNLGVTIGIQSASQTDRNTIVLNEFYDTAKEKTLSDFDWGFASTYRTLSLTGEKSLNPKYLYEYDYPNDCALVREILSRNSEKVEFEVSSKISGQKVIYTNQENAIIRYTRFVKEETYYTPEFAMALSWYLAFLSAKAITGVRANTSDCLTLYKQMLNEAKVTDSNEGYIKEDFSCDWLEARE